MCGNSFNETAADAICKYMGYTFASGWTSQVDSFEIRYGLEIKVSDVQCSSADWNNCNFTEEHDCVHTQDLFLSCSHQLMHGEGEKETTGAMMKLILYYNFVFLRHHCHKLIMATQPCKN